mmetsp:Transcript_33853/g.54200  ORF Transcript_33853/g.54200 Transcript_33853/m.54200 type:complete len:244 (-) Transcript_33853:1195-1926(-)
MQRPNSSGVPDGVLDHGVQRRLSLEDAGWIPQRGEQTAVHCECQQHHHQVDGEIIKVRGRGCQQDCVSGKGHIRHFSELLQTDNRETQKDDTRRYPRSLCGIGQLCRGVLSRTRRVYRHHARRDVGGDREARSGAVFVCEPHTSHDGGAYPRHEYPRIAVKVVLPINEHIAVAPRQTDGILRSGGSADHGGVARKSVDHHSGRSRQTVFDDRAIAIRRRIEHCDQRSRRREEEERRRRRRRRV